MENSDRERFGSLLGALAETFKRPMNEGLLMGYWLALSDELDMEGMESAVRRCLKTCQFMPSPSEILASSRGMSHDEIAERAWLSLLGAIRKTCGEDMTFEDGNVAAIVERMGGWEHVSGLESEELLKWGRKEFLALYSGFLRDGVMMPEATVFGWLASGSHKGGPEAMRIEAPYREERRRIGA